MFSLYHVHRYVYNGQPHFVLHFRFNIVRLVRFFGWFTRGAIECHIGSLHAWPNRGCREDFCYSVRPKMYGQFYHITIVGIFRSTCILHVAHFVTVDVGLFLSHSFQDNNSEVEEKQRTSLQKNITKAIVAWQKIHVKICWTICVFHYARGSGRCYHCAKAWLEKTT